MSRPDLEAAVRRKYEDPAEVAEFAALAGRGLTGFEEALVGAFASGDLVLDVGCGGGREAVPMARRGIRVVAMDLVPAMVRSARRHAAGQGVRVLPVVASVTALPFRDGVFDGVAMLGQVIAHVPDRAGRTGALRAVRQSLRPGGTLAMTTHNRRCHVKFRLYFAVMNLWRRMRRGLGVPSMLGDYDRWTARISGAGSPAPVFFHMHDRDEALAELRQAGFAVRQARSREEFEAGRDDPARRDRDYLLGFLASRPEGARGGGPLRIVLLAEVTIESTSGGAERVLREQALVLQRLGHQVAIVARAPDGDPRPRVAIGGATEYRYAVARTHAPAFAWSSVRGAVQAFDRARASETVDCVLIHQSLAGLGPLLRRRAQAGRWLYLCLSLAHEEYAARTPAARGAAAAFSRALHVRARRWVEGLVMRRCASVIVLSEFMKQRVQRVHGIPGSRIRIIPGAVDPARFCPPADPVAVRRQLGLPLDKAVLFTARRLEPRMGLGNLLQAMIELGPGAEDCLVLIAGEGMLRPALEGMIRDLKLADRVRLLGVIPDKDLPKYFQAADLVVMPTQELEGFGLVTVEALACGVPVLGTPVGAIPEVLARVDPRLLAEGADAGALAAGIRRVLERFRDLPGERERLSVKGRALVERDYTWVRHGEQLDRALRDACAGNGSSHDGHGMAARKVVHVITRFDWGGSAKIVMQTALGHDWTRFEPLVVMGNPDGAGAQGGREAMEENVRRLDGAGIRWVSVPTLVRNVHPIKDAAALWALWRLFRRERPAIVHTHTSKAGALGRLAAALAGVPVVVHTPHGHVFYGHFGRIASWLCVQMERLLARWMTRCIALTEDERRDYRARGIGRADQVAVVPSAIELDRFQRAGGAGRGSLPPGFDCPAGARIVGSVGWLTPVKGHRYLIEALAKLKPAYPDLCGVIVGSGDLHYELAALAERLGVRPSLRFLGRRDDVAECVAAMDIFVLPSLNEGMGRALVEAMAAGRPVVASRVGGVPAVVEDRVTGLLVPPADAEALAAAIRALLDRPEWARELGAAAAKQIGDRFSEAVMIRSVESLYEEALNAVTAR